MSPTSYQAAPPRVREANLIGAGGAGQVQRLSCVRATGRTRRDEGTSGQESKRSPDLILVRTQTFLRSSTGHRLDRFSNRARRFGIEHVLRETHRSPEAEGSSVEIAKLP